MTPIEMIQDLTDLIQEHPEIANKNIVFYLSETSCLSDEDLKNLSLTNVELDHIWVFEIKSRPDLTDLNFYVKLKKNA